MGVLWREFLGCDGSAELVSFTLGSGTGAEKGNAYLLCLEDETARGAAKFFAVICEIRDGLLAITVETCQSSEGDGDRAGQLDNGRDGPLTPPQHLLRASLGKHRDRLVCAHNQ